MLGHLWTILPKLADAVRPLEPPASERWQTRTRDGVTVRGWLRAQPGEAPALRGPTAMVPRASLKDTPTAASPS